MINLSVSYDGKPMSGNYIGLDLLYLRYYTEIIAGEAFRRVCYLSIGAVFNTVFKLSSLALLPNFTLF